jgi:hypothetical protein
MNLDDLTYGQLKKIASMFQAGNPPPSGTSILADAIGQYCIVRTRNEGINFGKVVMADNTGVVIEEARRIYYHKPKDNKVSWYEGVATTGLHEDSKISGEVSRKYIIEDYSLTICSPEAVQSIKDHVATGS